MSLWQIALAAGGPLAVRESPRWGTALDWAFALTILLSALILVCILASRIVFRGSQTEGNALWLHLCALGIFPLGLLAIGNFAVFEYAREVRFCGSCHLTMKVYIDDLHDPKRQSLAALHFQHRATPGTECYSCHADYGIHGEFQAKLNGLRDVYRYVTGTYHLPIRLSAPFKNALCLRCHEGAKRFMAQEWHLEDGKVSPELRREETSCVECHSPAHDLGKRQQAGERRLTPMTGESG